jgi:GLPGLI family protein
MSILTYLIFFCFTLSVFSQEGSVIYRNEASILPEYLDVKANDSVRWEKAKSFVLLQKKMMSKIQYKLHFSDQKSLFKPIMNQNDDRLLKLAKNKSGVFYKDNEVDYFYTNKRYRNFNVQLAPIKWEITDVSKQILGYTCYKASGTKTYNDSSTSDPKIEAWFTKEIKLTHGPRGIHGLPGLILEAHQGSYHFYAEELNFETQESISKPTKGEEINEAEYYKLMRSAVKN